MADALHKVLARAFKRALRNVFATIAPWRGMVDSRQEALATLIGTMPLRVIMIDREMRVLAASTPSADGMQAGSEGWVGRNLFEIDPVYFGPFEPIARQVLEDGGVFTAPRVRARDGFGKDVWLRTQISPWRDSWGRIAGLISVSIEITDVLDALDTSRRSEQRLNLALEIAELHVWELDFATREMTTAGAVETFFDGSITDEQIAADTSITIHPEDRERVEAAWIDALSTDTPYRPEYRINRADDKEVWAACTAKLIRNAAGEPVQLVGAMQNITARKEAEAELVQAKEDAEAANRAKSVFLATMGHEIRTPLNGVLGMAQAMAADGLEPAQRARLETIRQSGEALLTILDDLLDLSKIEAGKLELEVTAFPLTPLLNGVAGAFAELAGSKAVALRMDVEPSAVGVYRGDPTRLRQILFNLVSNALKFTHAGEVRVVATLEGDLLRFDVIDTGIGIPADRLGRLFNKFEQADASTTRRFGGTGLGLAISRELAVRMDGGIAVTSKMGAGSTFTLTVRLPRLGDEAPATPARSATAAFTPDRPLRVLAAEDNAVNRLVLRTLLQQLGIQPQIVEDGAAAVSAWREDAWDLILMDVQMPVMDGPTATRLIRGAEAGSGRPRTPIVALTANAMSHQMEEYLAAGMDGLVAKPIRVEELVAVLQSATDGPLRAAAAA